ncbi:MAG: hypothetical protein QM765_27925 [Myxococcales bacterium]
MKTVAEAAKSGARLGSQATAIGASAACQSWACTTSGTAPSRRIASSAPRVNTANRCRPSSRPAASAR